MLRKTGYAFILCFLCLQLPYVHAQLACGYAFDFTSQIAYSPLPGSHPTLILASGADRPDNPDDISPTDEDFFPGQAIGFPFQFNGKIYQKLGVATNGWIWFGENNPVKAGGLVIPFTNILATEHTLEAVVSALNGDLEGRWSAEPATISTRLDGTAPNRTFTVEWKNFKALDDAEGTGYCGENRNRFDFQIILEEGSQKISIAYNANYCWQGYNQLFQVGLKGNKPGDVHTRSIPAGQQAWESSKLGLDNSTVVIRSSAPVTTPPANARFVFFPSEPKPMAWKGVNTNWFDKGNWSDGKVPTRCNEVRIPSGMNYYPELSGNSAAECGSLLIEQGAALTLRQDYKSFLTLYGDLTNQGMISNQSASYLTLAGGSGRKIGGDGYFIGTDLFISAGSAYGLENDLAIRNLHVNKGSQLSLNSFVLDVYSLFQQGILKQGTGTLVIEGGPDAVQLNDSTFFAESGTTFFGNGEVWAEPKNQLVPSLKYHNLWVRTNKDYSVQLGSDKDFECQNLLFYNPGAPGGQASTARNIRVKGDFRLGIDSLPGTSLALNHAITRTNGSGQFKMGEKDQLNITHSSGTGQTAISGFAAPWFRGTVTYSGNNQQTLIKGTYQHLNITGSGQRTIRNQVNLRGVLRVDDGNLQTNDSLTLKSDSSTTALISGKGTGTISGRVELERFVQGSGEQEVLFGSAFQTAVLRDFADDIPVLGPDGVQLSASSEPTVWEFRSDMQDADFMSAWYSRTKLNEYIETGTGLLGKAAGGSVIRTAGLVNAGTRRVALQVKTGGGSTQGFNLLSNPYPSPIDWNKLVQLSEASMSRSMNKLGSGNRFNGQFATWLPLGSEEGLGINGASRYISSQEGFFVQAFKNDTLAFTDQCRVEVLNTRSVTVPEVIPYVRLSLQHAGKADETVVYFSSVNSNFEAVDGKDAPKMLPARNLHYWYSIKDSVKLAIQGRKSIETRDSVPLGIYAAQAGMSQLRLTEAQHFPATAMLFLEDKKTGTFTNLRRQPSVDVQLDAGENLQRFVLHFRPGVRVTAFREGCEGGNGRIAFNNTSGTPWDMSVYNSSDSLIHKKSGFMGAWQLEQLPADEYRIHFKLSGQNLEVDEWAHVLKGNAVQASLQVSANEVHPEEEILFTGKADGAEGWFWNFGDGMMASGDSIQTHAYPDAGLYEVVLTVTRGECSDTAVQKVRISTVAGLGESAPVDPTSFLIFPNPATVVASMRLKNEKPLQDAGLFVIDMNGKLAFEKHYSRIEPGQTVDFQVDRLAKGNYEVVVNAGSFRSVSKLVVAGK